MKAECRFKLYDTWSKACLGFLVAEWHGERKESFILVFKAMAESQLEVFAFPSVGHPQSVVVEFDRG